LKSLFSPLLTKRDVGDYSVGGVIGSTGISGVSAGASGVIGSTGISGVSTGASGVIGSTGVGFISSVMIFKLKN
jgi:hypothetical protein